MGIDYKWLIIGIIVGMWLIPMLRAYLLRKRPVTTATA